MAQAPQDKKSIMNKHEEKAKDRVEFKGKVNNRTEIHPGMNELSPEVIEAKQANYKRDDKVCPDITWA